MAAALDPLVAARRMTSLALIGATRLELAGDPAAVVGHLGAMQAQDLSSGLWSIGIRAGGTVSDVLAAIERREITRTWPMRGTLHWVPVADAGWMCRQLSGPAQRAARRVLAHEGLTDEIIERAGAIWAERLAGAGRTPVESRPAPGAGSGPVAQPGQMTRAEATAVLAEHGIDGSGQRTYHLLVRHCQQGLLCQGPIRRTASGALEPTFVLLEAWAPTSPGRAAGADPTAGDQALLMLLIERYVGSHAPVTEADLARWCDQPLRPLRAALAALHAAGRVATARAADGSVWLVPGDRGPLPAVGSPAVPAPGPATEPRSVLLVPGFDEWLLGYADRSAQLSREQQRLVAPGGNGVFRGTVVVDARVVGTWRRDPARRRGLALLVSSFEPLGTRVRRGLAEAAAAYGAFWEHPGEVEVRVDG